MRGIRSLITLLVVFVLAAAAHGEEKRWSDEAEFSVVDTGGNTEVTTLSAKNRLKYEFTDNLKGGWKLVVPSIQKVTVKRMQRATSLNYERTICSLTDFTLLPSAGSCETSLQVLTRGITWVLA